MCKIKYHHISLRVINLEKSAKFYQRLFGYQEILRHESSARGLVLHLAQAANAPVLELIQTKEPFKPITNSFHLGFSCKKIEVFIGQLLEMNLSIERGPFTVAQETIIFMKDPDGYLIEINDSL